MCLRFAFLLITRVITALARVPDPPQPAPASLLLHAAAPLKPLPEPVDLEQYRVRRQARVGGMIGEYRLVA
jgi:hypothetical protein